MQGRIVSRQSNAMMLFGPTRGFRKSYNADYYNRRFTQSQGKDGDHMYTASHHLGPNGAPAVS